jgi:hypothetical protein
MSICVVTGNYMYDTKLVKCQIPDAVVTGISIIRVNDSDFT